MLSLLHQVISYPPDVLGCSVCVHTQLCSLVQLCNLYELWPARLLCPWDFSRQEYWSELPFPPPRHPSNPRIISMSPVSPALQADSLSLGYVGSPLCCSMHFTDFPSISTSKIFPEAIMNQKYLTLCILSGFCCSKGKGHDFFPYYIWLPYSRLLFLLIFLLFSGVHSS